MRNMNKYVVTCLLASLLMCGCSRDKDKTADESKKKSDRLNAVALIGDSSLSDDEIRSYVRSRSHRGTAAEILERALDELVVAELLFREAINREIDQEPDVRQAMRQLLGQKLLEEQVNIPVLKRQIPEEELRQYYDEHQNLYSRPEQIRLADIFFAAPIDSDETRLNEQKMKAEEIFLQAQSVNKERFGFSQLIRNYSDKHPKYRLGDTGFFSRSGEPGGLAEELVEAGFLLSANGKIADKVIQTDNGFHIIKLVSRRPPFSREFSGVTKEIEQRIRKENLSVKRSAFIASLRKQAKVEVQQDVLDNIRRELTESGNQTAVPGSDGNSRKPILPGQ